MAPPMLPWEALDMIIALSIPPIVEIENDGQSPTLSHTPLPQLYISKVFRQTTLYYIRSQTVCRLSPPGRATLIIPKDAPYSNFLLPSHVGTLHVPVIGALALPTTKESMNDYFIFSKRYIAGDDFPEHPVPIELSPRVIFPAQHLRGDRLTADDLLAKVVSFYPEDPKLNAILHSWYRPLLPFLANIESLVLDFSHPGSCIQAGRFRQFVQRISTVFHMLKEGKGNLEVIACLSEQDDLERCVPEALRTHRSGTDHKCYTRDRELKFQLR